MLFGMKPVILLLKLLLVENELIVHVITDLRGKVEHLLIGRSVTIVVRVTLVHWFGR